MSDVDKQLPKDLGWKINSMIHDAIRQERRRCAAIVATIKDEVRSKAPGLEYHLVLAEQRIWDTR